MSEERTNEPEASGDRSKAGAPAPDPGTPPAPPPAAPPPESEGPDWETRFKYLLADFENFRKRGERERDGLRRRAEADLLRSFLPIHDAFERARSLVATAGPNDPVRRGMELLAKEWDLFLERQHVEPVAEVGEPFDSEVDEAVGEAPAKDGAAPGTVVEVVQQGYRFSGGLLRPAKVLVAESPPPSASRGEEGKASSREKER